MSPELIPFPKPEPRLDTPEDIRECFNLADQLDEQFGRWRSLAVSPAMRQRRLADYIVEDLSPLGRDPIDYSPEATFGGTMTREDAALKTNYEKRRSVLSRWSSNEDLDDIAPYNEAAAEYFSDIEEFAKNPYAPESFRIATEKLYRLFILREQLAKKIDKVKKLDISAIIGVYVRIAEDLT